MQNSSARVIVKAKASKSPQHFQTDFMEPGYEQLYIFDDICAGGHFLYSRYTIGIHCLAAHEKAFSKSGSGKILRKYFPPHP